MKEMNCINPGEIKEGDLMAYVHGEAPARVAPHVARCPYCADQVERLRLVDTQLLADFYREDCPNPARLADFALNRLPAVERLRVAAHVRGCALCAQEVTQARSLVGDDPVSLLDRLREKLALAMTARPVIPMTAAPVRGDGGTEGRFEVDGWVITLASSARRLVGRVRRRDLTGGDYRGAAWLLRENMIQDDEVIHSEVDERGRFRFRSLAAGTYALLLRVGDQYVDLDQVEIV